MLAEEEYKRVWNLAPNLTRGLQPIEIRHANVHQYNIRLNLLCLFDCFNPVGGFTTYFQLRMLFQNRTQPSPEYFVVVNNENSRPSHFSLTRSRGRKKSGPCKQLLRIAEGYTTGDSKSSAKVPAYRKTLI